MRPRTTPGRCRRTPQMALATTYFAVGVRLVREPTMVSGAWRDFIPDTESGQPVTTPRNPLITG